MAKFYYEGQQSLADKSILVPELLQKNRWRVQNTFLHQ